MMKVNNFKNDTYDKSDKNVNIQLTDELIGNGSDLRRRSDTLQNDAW